MGSGGSENRDMAGHDGPSMDVDVRAATPDDGADALLYASAPVYYDAFARGEARARRLLRAIHPRSGHTASWEVCRVAVRRGEVIGVAAAFPVAEAERLARRFMTLTFARVAPWHWPHLVRHLNAAARVSPSPPAGSWYVDALAVAELARRQGVARALLDDAEAVARERGATGVALDTG